MALANTKQNTRIKEVVAAWGNVRQLLRSGDGGQLVPVVIPRHATGFTGYFLVAFGLYLFASGILMFNALSFLFVFGALGALTMGSLILWRSIVIKIEQGTTGILSRFGKIVATLPPGRRYLWSPWDKVEFIVDTSTEIPYTAPVVASPTAENVPLKSIEFFLKFRIQDPVKFVRHIGASNFDIVLSSAVQDAIRRRSRAVRTEDAYDLRGSDVGDMQDYLNRQLERYGVRIVGANIPDVQLPTQYQNNLAMRETMAKELVAYEKEWELKRKQRMDNLLLEIERSKKLRDARLIEVNEAINKAREDVAQMLQEQETAAQKIRLEIEAEGQAKLAAAENEAKALNRLGSSYKDNWAVLQYELAVQRLQVAEGLVQHAPRPIIVNSGSEGGGGGDGSALSMLMMAQLLPKMMAESGNGRKSAQNAPAAAPPNTGGENGELDRGERNIINEVTRLVKRLQKK